MSPWIISKRGVWCNKCGRVIPKNEPHLLSKMWTDGNSFADSGSKYCPECLLEIEEKRLKHMGTIEDLRRLAQHFKEDYPTNSEVCKLCPDRLDCLTTDAHPSMVDDDGERRTCISKYYDDRRPVSWWNWDIEKRCRKSSYQKAVKKYQKQTQTGV